MSYETIILEKDNTARIAVITLNRPKALNALCAQLTGELACALEDCEADDKVRAIVITGSDKAFAAGADIKEIASKNFSDMRADDFVEKSWERVARVKKPVIAAVAGYALGGGCELAMMCDIILAANTAKFGQPEITIGTIPGAGGTQRLTRLIGKPKAMEMCLTGRMMDATEAERAGLVARIVPAADLMAEARALAAKIASFSAPVAAMVKACVNQAYETSLLAGIAYERGLFQATFGTKDQQEGMAAFAEKRKADWQDQ